MPLKSTIDPYYFSIEWRALRNAVLLRDGKLCQYCGNRGTQADHVRPRKSGGPDSPDNLVCCCPRCNQLAGGRRFRSFETKKQWLLKQIAPTQITICNGQLPDSGAYQRMDGLSTKKRRASWGRRRNARKRS